MQNNRLSMISKYLLLICIFEVLIFGRSEEVPYDWNCYEFCLFDVLICFVKGSPEGSGEPVHSTIYHYSCGMLPARPSIMYILTTGGLNECYTAPLCENSNYWDSNT